MTLEYGMMVIGALTLLTLWIGWLLWVCDKDAESQKFEVQNNMGGKQ